MILEKLLAYGKTFARARYEWRLPDILRLLVKRPVILAGVGAYETALLGSGVLKIISSSLPRSRPAP